MHFQFFSHTHKHTVAAKEANTECNEQSREFVEEKNLHEATSKADKIQDEANCERENGAVSGSWHSSFVLFESSVKFALYLINKFILANIARRAANG